MTAKHMSNSCLSNCAAGMAWALPIVTILSSLLAMCFRITSSSAVMSAGSTSGSAFHVVQKEGGPVWIIALAHQQCIASCDA